LSSSDAKSKQSADDRVYRPTFVLCHNPALFKQTRYEIIILISVGKRLRIFHSRLVSYRCKINGNVYSINTSSSRDMRIDKWIDKWIYNGSFQIKFWLCREWKLISLHWHDLTLQTLKMTVVALEWDHDRTPCSLEREKSYSISRH
jgi:hypothetical protein